MGLFDFFGGGGKSSREVRHLRMTLEPVEGTEILQGQPAQLKLTVKASGGTPVRAAYLAFDLVNRREERRGLFERLVTQSRFVYRFNLDHDLEPNTEWVHKLTFLPPVCREGTRHSKYVSILWEILPQLTCGPSGATVPHPPPFCLVGQKLEVEVHSRR